MRAAMLYGAGDLRLVSIEKPIPRREEVLVQVKAVGICASDIHYFRDGRIGDVVVTEPIILGHEFSGMIVEVGEGVSNVKPGDRVAVEPAIACQKCDLCLNGDYNLCRNILFCGTPPTQGALREFLTWPAHLVYKVPDSMSYAEAAMLEPIAIGVYAVDLAQPIQGKTVGILGAGGIGISIMQAARAAGCGDIFVTDLIPERLDIAKKLGATQIFRADETNLVKQIISATHGRGLDIVFEAAGENEAVQQSTEIVRPGGLVLVGGIPREDSMTVTASTVRRKGLTIKLIRRSNKTLERSIDLVCDGKIDAASMVTH
ncbi:MAG: alcohol dehydrogenase catalytic domain-containing protein, partial [Armatimonadota bacterium]|nr:alcohol dehydrogenase catalytic domain-containing protein [Armatimonadota bacterium]